MAKVVARLRSIVVKMALGTFIAGFSNSSDIWHFGSARCPSSHDRKDPTCTAASASVAKIKY